MFSNLVTSVFLFILDRIRSLKESSIFISAFKISLFILVAAIIGSSLFYWRLVDNFDSPHNFDTWTTAFDVSFAHAVVTLPIALFIFTTIVLVVSLPVIAKLIYSEVVVNEEKPIKKRSKYQKKILNWGAAFLDLVLVTGFFSIIGGSIYFVIKTLLHDYPNFQFWMFGAYDGSLGWNFPTVFRFSALYANIMTKIELFNQNPVFSSIIGFVGILGAVIIGIGGFLRALGEIENRLTRK